MIMASTNLKYVDGAKMGCIHFLNEVELSARKNKTHFGGGESKMHTHL